MTPFHTWLLRATMWTIVALLSIWWAMAAAQIPIDASRYKRDLIRNSRLVWGLDAPVSTFAAQIHQESGWRHDAKSHVGASGLAQFMPATAKWISGLYAPLKDNDPTNPAWAIRAMVEYNKWLYARVPSAATHCERMAFVLSSYNGGLGWLQRDVHAAKAAGADPRWWFDNVERYNGGRAVWAFKENRGYPNRILLELEPRYIKDGWGIHSC